MTKVEINADKKKPGNERRKLKNVEQTRPTIGNDAKKMSEERSIEEGKKKDAKEGMIMR